MRTPFVIAILILALTACAPQPTLNTGDAAEVQVYLALNGDVIVEAPRPVEYADVRVAADTVTSDYLVSPTKSVYGYFALHYPDEEAHYGRCLRIEAENVTAGWAGVTMAGDDFSEAKELDLRRRKPPAGC
jgi:hypothetical protein